MGTGRNSSPAAARGAGWFCPINSHGFVCAGGLRLCDRLVHSRLCYHKSLFLSDAESTNKGTSEEYDAHLRPFIRPGRGNKTEKGNPGQWAARLIAIILRRRAFRRRNRNCKSLSLCRSPLRQLNRVRLLNRTPSFPRGSWRLSDASPRDCGAVLNGPGPCNLMSGNLSLMPRGRRDCGRFSPPRVGD